MHDFIWLLHLVHQYERIFYLIYLFVLTFNILTFDISLFFFAILLIVFCLFTFKKRGRRKLCLSIIYILRHLELCFHNLLFHVSVCCLFSSLKSIFNVPFHFCIDFSQFFLLILLLFICQINERFKANHLKTNYLYIAQIAEWILLFSYPFYSFAWGSTCFSFLSFHKTY